MEIKMAKGGSRPGAGRKPGQKNKITIQQKRSLREIAGEYTGEAIKTLVAIMKDAQAPHGARATAATAILDRAHGKPTQSHEHSGPQGGPIEYQNLSEEEVDARLAALEREHGPSQLAH
jgi:hypothetical protein